MTYQELAEAFDKPDNMNCCCEAEREAMEAAHEVFTKLANGYKLCRVDAAIKVMEKLQRQEDMGIGYYNPPYYCERCIMILEAFIEEVNADDTTRNNKKS